MVKKNQSDDFEYTDVLKYVVLNSKDERLSNYATEITPLYGLYDVQHKGYDFLALSFRDRDIDFGHCGLK